MSIAICWQFVDLLLKRVLNYKPITVLASLLHLCQLYLQNKLQESLRAASQPLHVGSSHRGSAATILTSIHEDMGSIPGLTQWVKDLALP